MHLFPFLSRSAQQLFRMVFLSCWSTQKTWDGLRQATLRHPFGSFRRLQHFSDMNMFSAFAVYQCQHGADSPKPTRFLTSIQAAQHMPHMGPPRFDSEDKYVGPLPRYCGHRHKQRLLGASSTSAAAAYPADLCALISSWVFSVFDGGGTLATTDSSPRDSSEFTFSFPPLDSSGNVDQVGHLHPAEQLSFSCLKNGRISQGQLLRLSDLLPDEDRVRGSDKAIPGQRSFTTGAFVHQDNAGLRRNVGSFPFSSRLLAGLTSSCFQGRVFLRWLSFGILSSLPIKTPPTERTRTCCLLARSSLEGACGPNLTRAPASDWSTGSR